MQKERYSEKEKVDRERQKIREKEKLNLVN